MENVDNLAEPAGRLSQSTTLRGCYVPALVKGSVAWLLCLPVGQTLPLALSYRSTLFSFGEGPTVRIRFPPAESPCLTQTRPLQVENRGFRAGVRRSVGGAVGGDAQGGAISHQRTAISLLAPIPVPPCCRHGLGCLGTCRFRLGIERGSGSRKAEHGPLLMPGGKRWRR